MRFIKPNSHQEIMTLGEIRFYGFVMWGLGIVTGILFD